MGGVDLGVFTNAISLVSGGSGSSATAGSRGLAGWLLDRLRRTSIRTPRLALVERINLAPRQTLALIEADGERVLVATSPEGAPAFYALRWRSGCRAKSEADKPA